MAGSAFSSQDDVGDTYSESDDTSEYGYGWPNLEEPVKLKVNPLFRKEEGEGEETPHFPSIEPQPEPQPQPQPQAQPQPQPQAQPQPERCWSVETEETVPPSNSVQQYESLPHELELEQTRSVFGVVGVVGMGTQLFLNTRHALSFNPNIFQFTSQEEEPRLSYLPLPVPPRLCTSINTRSQVRMLLSVVEPPVHDPKDQQQEQDKAILQPDCHGVCNPEHDRLASETQPQQEQAKQESETQFTWFEPVVQEEEKEHHGKVAEVSPPDGVVNTPCQPPTTEMADTEPSNLTHSPENMTDVHTTEKYEEGPVESVIPQTVVCSQLEAHSSKSSKRLSQSKKSLPSFLRTKVKNLRTQLLSTPPSCFSRGSLPDARGSMSDIESGREPSTKDSHSLTHAPKPKAPTVSHFRHLKKPSWPSSPPPPLPVSSTSPEPAFVPAPPPQPQPRTKASSQHKKGAEAQKEGKSRSSFRTQQEQAKDPPQRPNCPPPSIKPSSFVPTYRSPVMYKPPTTAPKKSKRADFFSRHLSLSLSRARKPTAADGQPNAQVDTKQKERHHSVILELSKRIESLAHHKPVVSKKQQ